MIANHPIYGHNYSYHIWGDRSPLRNAYQVNILLDKLEVVILISVNPRSVALSGSMFHLKVEMLTQQPVSNAYLYL